ncbi:MAG TPA: glycosyltransferase family 4 protein [Limnochordales bacterium]
MQTAPSVLFVGSYPPRQCGIATFTRDLAHALQAVGGRPFQVIAVHNADREPEHPPEVALAIRRDRLEDYRRAADYVNSAPVDVVSLQHEFGLFGGQAGQYIHEFLRRVEKPVVTTLHTVIRQPEPEYREATLALIRHSERLVVMSEVARDILLETYRAPAEQITLVPHGVPDMPGEDPAALKAALGLAGRFVILTFGLLSRNKGIELMLDALPAVVAAHPEVLYVVLGATHPEVVRWEGESYRSFLEDKVRRLGLAGHVRFVNQYVDQETLLRYIHASDLYVTPYRNAEQVVSGTLSYALALGKPIVSTPYWYAQELLRDGRGVVVPFGDAGAMAAAVGRLIADREAYERISRAAYDRGLGMRWPVVAGRFAAVLAEAVAAGKAVAGAAAAAGARASGASTWLSADGQPGLPPIRLDHLRRLSDETGLLQHATHGVPDPQFGYSADDAGRALVVLMELYARHGRTDGLDLAETYLKFLRHAQRADGAFHNFVAYDRRYLDDQGSEDTLGRVLWGLGHVAKSAPEAGMRALASEMVQAARPHVENLHHLRAKAYAVCGLAAFAQSFAQAAEAAPWRALLERLAADLARRFEDHARPGWEWFEERLTYGNAILSYALLVAHRTTGLERFRRVGLRSLDFLWRCQWNGQYLDLIGNDGWASRDGQRAVFGQQPIDAGYMVLACAAAYSVTRQASYAQRARDAFAWFLGRNRLGQPLVDPATGAVSDGLEAHGVSTNQGAEAAISWLLAQLALARLAAPTADAAAPRAPARRPAANILPGTSRAAVPAR